MSENPKPERTPWGSGQGLRCPLRSDRNAGVVVSSIFSRIIFSYTTPPSDPDKPYVSLVVSVTENLRTITVNERDNAVSS